MGGRGSNSKIQRQNVPPVSPAPPAPPMQVQAQPQQPDDTLQPNVTPTAQAAQTANNGRFSATDNSPFHDLYNGRQYFQDQSFGIDTRMAIQDYLHDQATPGSLYSPLPAAQPRYAAGPPP